MEKIVAKKPHPTPPLRRGHPKNYAKIMFCKREILIELLVNIEPKMIGKIKMPVHV